MSAGIPGAPPVPEKLEEKSRQGCLRSEGLRSQVRSRDESTAVSSPVGTADTRV